MKCKNGCLARDTKILMADGSEKRISEICIGDMVQGYDGKLLKVYNIATGLEDNLLLKITTSSGKSLWLTGEHPILGKNKTWERAMFLKVHDPIQTIDGIDEVVSIYWGDYHGTVYNLVLDSFDDSLCANGIIVGDFARQMRWFRSDNPTEDTGSISELR